MKSFDITKRYLEIIRKEIIEPACCELRHDLKLPPIDEVKLSEREVEMFWGLHGNGASNDVIFSGWPPPKAKVTRSNCVGCAILPPFGIELRNSNLPYRCRLRERRSVIRPKPREGCK